MCAHVHETGPGCGRCWHTVPLQATSSLPGSGWATLGISTDPRSASRRLCLFGFGVLGRWRWSRRKIVTIGMQLKLASGPDNSSWPILFTSPDIFLHCVKAFFFCFLLPYIHHHSCCPFSCSFTTSSPIFSIVICVTPK